LQKSSGFDYPDKILARLDIVAAAIHSSFRHIKDEITGRLVDALANPHFDILAHPTSRLIGSREPLEMNFDRVLQGHSRQTSLWRSTAQCTGSI